MSTHDDTEEDDGTTGAETNAPSEATRATGAETNAPSEATRATERTEPKPPITSVRSSIQLEEVYKRYGSVTALDGVTLSIESGTFHALVGPNGSGKTTLFRVVAGLARPDPGRVVRPDASIGYSFQEPRFYPDLTVRENLSIFRSFGTEPTPSGWTDTLFEELGLQPAAHRRAGEVSGGFRKKLDLALALVNRPDYLLLDEPLADIDDRSRRRIRAFLRAYQREGRTVVVSTHNVEAFTDAIDRVTMLVDGRVRADSASETDGRVSEILERYRSAIGD